MSGERREGVPERRVERQAAETAAADGPRGRARRAGRGARGDARARGRRAARDRRPTARPRGCTLGCER